jgi:hypothetical protein
MARLDQGHLHPLLEHTSLTCPGRGSNPGSTVGGEHSSKELFKQFMLVFRISGSDFHESFVSHMSACILYDFV